MPPKHIAIIGGGLTGLSSAFHLSRRFPSSRITLVEKAQRLGGWVHSERVQVNLGGASSASVLLESGPRTLRPNSLAVLELINLLGLSSSVITVPRSAPAARNRFLHLPGSNGLIRIPSSLPALLISPLARILIPAVFSDVIRGSNRAVTAADDESVDSFLSRRFGPGFARTFGSALVHGIYATDSRVLSMRAAFPSLLDLEARGRGSVVRGAISGVFTEHSGGERNEEYEVGNVADMMQGVSVYSFKDGMGAFVAALKAALERAENVQIVQDAKVSQVSSNDGRFMLVTECGLSIESSHLVSAIPLRALDTLLQTLPSAARPPLPHLASNLSSSVAVVNLVFASPPGAPALHPPGFGFLIPRPAGGDYHAHGDNPMGILGTVFDSCAVGAQDAGAPITKMTVMLGGPYGMPDTDDPAFLDRLLRELARQLAGPPLPRPLLVRVHRHAACIPTPAVGHEARMAELRGAVGKYWGACAEVVGAEVGGVSVGACIEMGRSVGREW